MEIGEQIAHAKVAKDGKEDWLLQNGERIAHVPHSRDALSRAKDAKGMIFDFETMEKMESDYS